MWGQERVHHVNFLQPHQRGVQHFSLPEYSENSGKCISITLSTHVETVVLLSKWMVDTRKVKVDFSCLLYTSDAADEEDSGEFGRPGDSKKKKKGE